MLAVVVVVVVASDDDDDHDEACEKLVYFVAVPVPMSFLAAIVVC